MPVQSNRIWKPLALVSTGVLAGLLLMGQAQPPAKDQVVTIKFEREASLKLDDNQFRELVRALDRR
jgi:hypothetical protein